MRSALVLHGPNLNLLGTRRPEVYGATTLADLEDRCREWGAAAGFAVECHQSNHEGDLVDRLHAAGTDAVLLNAGALTHYSYALHDAVEAIAAPVVEVHISNVRAREAWRRTSVVAPACVATIYGRGIQGYRWAFEHLAARLAWEPEVVGYGPGADHVGDLRVPAGPGPHPVAVLVHGGFWRDPWQRDLMDGLAADLPTHGLATWNVEYRRAGTGGGWPETAVDVGAAVDHVAALAADRALDPARVVLVGHSAGGHLALWAAARAELLPGAPGAAPAVQPIGVVALAPVADLAAAFHAGLGEGAVAEFLAGHPDRESARYHQATPVLGIVPTVVVHGDRDDRVPIGHSRGLGDRVALIEAAGADHFDLIDPRSKAWEGARYQILAAAGVY